jgi:DNA-binding FrmR family transcriptional regulator
MTKPLAVKKTKALKLSKQARGTLETVVAMIESDTYCPEIIQQADSVIGLLKSVKRELLAGHLDTCVMRNMQKDKPGAIRELVKIYNLSS